jgi:hypothetical protein
MIRRILKARSPSRSGICNKNIQLPLNFLYLFDQTYNLCFRGNIGWDADRTASDSRQLVEFFDGLIDALWSAGFASCDDDFVCTCTKECCRGVKTKSS